MSNIKEAMVALASYQQADEDGIMVLVSRQAVDEVLAHLRTPDGALNWLYGEASALLNRHDHPDAEAYAPLRAALRHASDLLGLKSPISGDGDSGYEVALKRQAALRPPAAAVGAREA